MSQFEETLHSHIYTHAYRIPSFVASQKRAHYEPLFLVQQGERQKQVSGRKYTGHVTDPPHPDLQE